jgi:hypothetical protein
LTELLYHLANRRYLLLNGFDERDFRTLHRTIPDPRPGYDRFADQTENWPRD